MLIENGKTMTLHEKVSSIIDPVPFWRKEIEEARKSATTPKTTVFSTIIYSVPTSLKLRGVNAGKLRELCGNC